jgi:hypothetical protein
MGIQGIRWESREYDGNPGNTMGIPGIRWESGEYDGNPGNTIKIQGILEIPGIRNPPFPPSDYVSPMNPAVSETCCCTLHSAA